MIKLINKNIRDFISDPNFSEVFTGSLWALSTRVIIAGLSLSIYIITARVYGADVLGVVAVLNSFLLLITIFTILGTNTSILRLIPEHFAKYSSASAFAVYRKTKALVICTSVLAGTIVFFSADYIADSVFSKPHLEHYFSLAAVFIVFKSLMELNTGAVRGIRLIRTFAFMHLLPYISQFIILVCATVFLFHDDNPIYALFASLAITALTGSWIMDRVFKKKISPNDNVYSSIHITKIISISFPMLLNAAMNFIIAEIGIIMMGIFRPEAEVGYYSVAVRLSSLTIVALGAINSMAASKYSELFHSAKISDLFQVAKKTSKLSFWATLPIFLFLIVLGKPLLFFLFGPDFTVVYYAMVFLVIGHFISSASGSTGTFMNMTGRQNILVCVKTIAVFLNIALNLAFTPSHGIYGASLAAMISIIFWNITILVYIKLKYGKNIGYFPFFKY